MARKIMAQLFDASNTVRKEENGFTFEYSREGSNWVCDIFNAEGLWLDRAIQNAKYNHIFSSDKQPKNVRLVSR